ncbi:hypothetical protein ABS71_07735 [bacterium SCN 62-11]|nr:MAG: hypothetical protein ABS71_07735 [bacterium SCN 62-11]
MAILPWLQNLDPARNSSDEPSLIQEIQRMALDVLDGKASYGAWQGLVRTQQNRLKKAYLQIKRFCEEVEDDHPSLAPALQARDLIVEIREFLKALREDVHSRQVEEVQTLLKAIEQRAIRLSAAGMEMEEKIESVACPDCGHWNSPSWSVCEECQAILAQDESLEIDEDAAGLPPDYQRLWELLEAVQTDPGQEAALQQQILLIDGNLEKSEPLAETRAILKALKTARRGLALLTSNPEQGWQTLMNGMARFEELTED